jgi:hypothetical protein
MGVLSTDALKSYDQFVLVIPSGSHVNGFSFLEVDGTTPTVKQHDIPPQHTSFTPVLTPREGVHPIKCNGPQVYTVRRTRRVWGSLNEWRRHGNVGDGTGGQEEGKRLKGQDLGDGPWCGVLYVMIVTLLLLCWWSGKMVKEPHDIWTWLDLS